jgi:hypothetical protein
MSKVPETDSGLTEEMAIQSATLLRQGWDVLRSLQFNKTASILRYEVTKEGRPDLGIEDTAEQVSDLADLPVLISRLSTWEVIASGGVLELTDMIFDFYEEVKATDKILYDEKTYEVIRIKFWDADVGRCIVIGRAI